MCSKAQSLAIQSNFVHALDDRVDRRIDHLMLQTAMGEVANVDLFRCERVMIHFHVADDKALMKADLPTFGAPQTTILAGAINLRKCFEDFSIRSAISTTDPRLQRWSRFDHRLLVVLHASIQYVLFV